MRKIASWVIITVLFAVVAIFSFLTYKGATIAVPSSKEIPTVIRHDGATGKCKDGYYTYSTHTQGTCSSHKGVEEWYVDQNTGEPLIPINNTTNATSNSSVPSTKTSNRTPEIVQTQLITNSTPLSIKTCAINISVIRVLCK